MKSYTSSFGDIFLTDDIASLYPMAAQIHRSGTFILADHHTAHFCLPKIAPGLSSAHLITIAAGEEHKTLETCEQVWHQMIGHRADRDSLLLNVGGGVICDLGGFAAGCFQRGIRFAHIPTTVTAMTDAAIGGKVGVDFNDNKNYVGLFQSPEFIWIQPGFLETLPQQEICAGLAEIVKHAVIGSRQLWEALQRVAAPDQIDWMHILDLSIQVKQQAVNEDPFDRGRRKSLNFGHTIGHALESYYLHEGMPLPHGYAVAYGMMAEAKMAVDLKLLSRTDFEAIVERIHILIQPPFISIPAAESLDGWMLRDKKNSAGMRSFSLPAGIGACRWDVRDGDPAAAIDWLREHVTTSSFRLITDSN